MYARLLFPILAFSAATRAEQSWVFAPEQALVSVEVAGLSAVSHGLGGRVRELDSGAVQMEVRLPLASFTADRPLVANERTSHEIVFEGAAKKPGKDGTLHLKGTVSFHGARRTVEFPVTLVRTGGMVFGHTSVSVHLRDFGLALPQGTPDEARVTIDAGLHPERALASSG